MHVSVEPVGFAMWLLLPRQPGWLEQMREVATADGDVWECFIEWEGRGALQSSARYLRGAREARARRKAKDAKLDLLDGCDPLSAIDSWPMLVLALAIFIVVLIGPEFVALLFGVVELGAIVLLVVGGLIGRVLFRRPWRVVAVSDKGTVWAWRQVGIRPSLRLVDEIVDGLEIGHQPSMIASDRLEAVNPSTIADDASLGPFANPSYLWWARFVVITALLVSIVVVVERFR